MRLRVHRERCTGCESCVLTCSFEHEGGFRLAAARIQVERNENDGAFRPRVCIQCDERFCVAACPAGALSISPEHGFIRVDDAACVGCGACVAACPHGGIRWASGRRIPQVCDLCGGDPQCVKTCLKPRAIECVMEEAGDE